MQRSFPLFGRAKVGASKKKWRGGGRGGEGRGGEEKEMLAGKPHDSEESACPRAGVWRHLIGTAWSSWLTTDQAINQSRLKILDSVVYFKLEQEVTAVPVFHQIGKTFEKLVFPETGELTRTVLWQGLLPCGVLSNHFNMLLLCFGGVVQASDWLPIELLISLNNIPKFRIFRVEGWDTRSENSAGFLTASNPTSLQVSVSIFP